MSQGSRNPLMWQLFRPLGMLCAECCGHALSVTAETLIPRSAWSTQGMSLRGRESHAGM